MSQPLRVTLRQLRAFVEVFRLRNLTHAADSLHMTQSAMSALIQQMEESLGVQLFERTPRMLRPTEAAEEAYVQATEILARVTTLQLDMAERAKAAQSTMAFSCVPTLTSGVVASVIAEFQAKVPSTRTVVYDDLDSGLIDRVLSGKAEFSISPFKYDPDLIESIPLTESFLSLICHRDSDLATKEQVVWRDLLDRSVINLYRGYAVQELIAKIFPIDGRPFESAFEVGYIETGLAMTAQKLGVVILPDYFVSSNPHFESLIARKLHDPEVEQTLFIHIRKGHSLSEPAQTFTEMLRHRLSR